MAMCPLSGSLRLFTARVVAGGDQLVPRRYRSWAPQGALPVLDLVEAIFVSRVGEWPFQRQQSSTARSAPQGSAFSGQSPADRTPGQGLGGHQPSSLAV